MTDEHEGNEGQAEDGPQVAVEGDQAHVDVNPSEGNDGETAAEQEARLAEGSAEVKEPDLPPQSEQPAPGSIPADTDGA